MSTLQEIQAQIAELQKQAQQMVEAQRQPIIEKMKANEFLHLDYARRLTASVAEVVARMP